MGTVSGGEKALRHPGAGVGAGPSRASPERDLGAERLNRNYNELLQELRVTQTGTQILFAFLLTIAFTRPFQDAGAFTHQVYAVTLVLCAVASALLIAPVALHRTVFRHGLKQRLVTLSNRFAQYGVYVLLAAMTGALLIALDVVLSRPVALVVVGAVAAGMVGLWVVLPLLVRGATRSDLTTGSRRGR